MLPRDVVKVVVEIVKPSFSRPTHIIVVLFSDGSSKGKSSVLEGAS